MVSLSHDPVVSLAQAPRLWVVRGTPHRAFSNQRGVVPGVIVMPEVPVGRLLQVSAIFEGSEVDTLVFDAAPLFHKNVLMVIPLLFMLIRMPCSLRTLVNASQVNWTPLDPY
ncbi:MAG: hypothetical protein AWU57_2908 [Marinobacter sp. T13-3]|nr:MAG: hypothetical protein AWU57_2908 [Marinobacter sp. T13-3]